LDEIGTERNFGLTKKKKKGGIQGSEMGEWSKGRSISKEEKEIEGAQLFGGSFKIKRKEQKGEYQPASAAFGRSLRWST